jgi:phage terminase large subunit GpA-like protein
LTQAARTSRYAVGAVNFAAELINIRREALAPPPILTLSEWAERFAYLSRETSAEPGKFRAFAYQNGILDAVTDPAVRTITVMKSARVGFTKMLDHVVGFFIHQDPSPILIVQPRVEDAEDYSRTEIAPMLRDTPCLAAIAGDLKAKDSDQRILKRVFRNGASVSFVGANSPGGFRRITARVVAFDEVDGYPSGGAGLEGDQIALGTKRTETFWNRKIILGSTPTAKGVSRIEKSWEESDKRRYFVPCPHCGHKQTIQWRNIRWDRDEATGEHLPRTAHLICEENGCVIEERHKPWMIDNGEWIAEAPFAGHAGFHIWAGYSLFPNASWGNLVEEWLRVHKDPMLLRTFINLVLGETWEEDADAPDWHPLYKRRESYKELTIPADALIVVMGVDVQKRGLFVEITGWTSDRRSYVILAQYLSAGSAEKPGDTSDPDDPCWKRLSELHETPLADAFGGSRRIDATGIDCRYNASCVYEWVRRHHNSYAIRTEEGWGRQALSAPHLIDYDWRGKRVRKGVQQWKCGSYNLKARFYAYLNRETSISDDGSIAAPSGYCHFGDFLDEGYFRQITAEYIGTDKAGNRIWKQREFDNHWLDCRVMAMALVFGAPVFDIGNRADDFWRQLAYERGIPEGAIAAYPKEEPEAEEPEVVETITEIPAQISSHVAPRNDGWGYSGGDWL